MVNVLSFKILGGLHVGESDQAVFSRSPGDTGLKIFLSFAVIDESRLSDRYASAAQADQSDQPSNKEYLPQVLSCAIHCLAIKLGDCY